MMFQWPLQRCLTVVAAALFGVVFSWAQAQTVSPPAAVSFEAGLQAAQSGDALQALRHFQVLAAQGHGAAQYNLGLMYLHGLGVPVKLGQARYWLSQSAGQGYPQAKVALARIQ